MANGWCRLTSVKGARLSAFSCSQGLGRLTQGPPSANASTILADLIDGALQLYHKQAIPAGTSVDAQSKILSMAATDGLARIGAECDVNTGASTLDEGGHNEQSYETGENSITLCRRDWCSQGYFVDDLSGPAILNGTVQDLRGNYEQLSSGFSNNVTGN